MNSQVWDWNYKYFPYIDLAVIIQRVFDHFNTLSSSKGISRFMTFIGASNHDSKLLY